MKYGLQVVQAWSPKNGVKNVSKFLMNMAKEAEDAGWDGFFLWDHLYFTWSPVAIPDSWSILSAAAARTDKIYLGTNVTAVTRRRPQVLAKQLVTIDQISDGRVILGAGLGGSGHQSGPGEDFTSFGEPADYKTLAKIADEALEVIIGLWSGEPLYFDGQFFKVNQVSFQPTPIQKPRIPIWIGAIKDQALRRAARYDGWVTGGPCPSAGDKGIDFKQLSEKMKLIKNFEEIPSSYEVVYAFEFPNNSMIEYIEGAKDVGVTWMLDVISALRFGNSENVLEHIKRGPPEIT
jgi:alkanesulfonate monooxygenase SsuD/methylene tetrahydromethanopterin reductase-like flavin-dependent oxidoreductase (luciferase family)